MVVCHYCFNLYFPDNIELEHLFICLFAICMSSLVSVKALGHFLIGLVFYFFFPLVVEF